MSNPFDKLRGKRQEQVEKPVSPLIFLGENEKVKPVYFLKDTPNGQNQFAILRTTENGKYVRGGMLYFRFNGVDIFTDINNIIFVNVADKSVTIREYEKVGAAVAPDNAEERQYILLMLTREDDQQHYYWESMTGRSTAYDVIKEYILDYDMDPDKSIVLVDSVPYKDALTVTEFVRYLKNAELIPDEEDGFDIEDYTKS